MGTNETITPHSYHNRLVRPTADTGIDDDRSADRFQAGCVADRSKLLDHRCAYFLRRMLEQGRTDEFVDLATRRAGAPRRGPSGELIPAERTKDAVDAMSAFYAQMPTIPVPDLRVYREKFAAEGMTQAVQDIDKEIEERKIANMIGQVPQTTQSVLNTWKRGVETLRQEMGRDPTPEELVLGLELSIEQITQGDPEQEATLMELMMSDHPVLIQYRQHLVDPQVPNPFDAQPQQPQRQPQGGVSGAHPEPTLQPGNTVTVNRQQGGS